MLAKACLWFLGCPSAWAWSLHAWALHTLGTLTAGH